MCGRNSETMRETGNLRWFTEGPPTLLNYRAPEQVRRMSAEKRIDARAAG
jgi:hypothetical protein